jgi:hypothetical protein
MIPPAWKAEYEHCEEDIRTVMLNDLDPGNLNGDAHRQWQRERTFNA